MKSETRTNHSAPKFPANEAKRVRPTRELNRENFVPVAGCIRSGAPPRISTERSTLERHSGRRHDRGNARRKRGVRTASAFPAAADKRPHGPSDRPRKGRLRGRARGGQARPERLRRVTAFAPTISPSSGPARRARILAARASYGREPDLIRSPIGSHS